MPLLSWCRFRAVHCAGIDIQNQRARLQVQLVNVKDRLTDAAAFVEKYLALLEDPRELYRTADDETRRRLNQAIFARIFIHEDEVTDHEPVEPVGDLLAAQTLYSDEVAALTASTTPRTPPASPRPRCSGGQKPPSTAMHEPPPGTKTQLASRKATPKGGLSYASDLRQEPRSEAPAVVSSALISSKGHLGWTTGLEPAALATTTRCSTD